ncbi:MXAN_6577-like cysteine-rich protein [Nannocystis sp.]|uniref:MXAN_6577-like cysteine-rich protein n=1 Tax=Nannocystis sp. TaxID=1962667 RepID=UPI003450FB1C|nr:hypothetical protein [Nannocystis sp.]
MRRGDRLSWTVCGLLLGCGGAGEGSEGASTGASTEASAATGAVTDAAPTSETDPTGATPATVATGAGCQAPLELCAGVCVDTQHDPQHCGGCDASCGDSLVCVAGACGVACGASAVACGEDCSDLQIDPAHCGACDHACAPGVACVAGSCVPDCGEGETLCGESCVDAGNDEAHCGGCDMACPMGQPCVYGACVAAEIHHLLISGQSLSTGATSPVVSDMQPFTNLSFNTGVRAGGVGLTGFIPLVETWDGSQGETIASGWRISSRRRRRRRAGRMSCSRRRTGSVGRRIRGSRRGRGPTRTGWRR